MQRWLNSTGRNGRLNTATSRFYAVDLPRLFAVFNDPASWPMEAPERLITISQDQLLSYSFDNETRVEIRFERVRSGLVRVVLEHEQLHDESELKACQAYWNEILEDISVRLLCEPVHAATANGKINLFFKVGPLLENGYHQVASLYQAVDLAETVIAEPAAEWEVVVTGTIGAEHLAGVPTGQSNLVVKAAKATGDALRYERVPKLRLTIHKAVPVAGGMGGGSADAAAAILACESLWASKLSAADRHEVAASLGADVPFALVGGAAIGVGTGHELEPVRQKAKLHWVLVPNDFGLSTPDVYRALDRLRADRGQDPASVDEAKVNSALVKALKAGASAEDIAPLLHNDLQEAAVSLRPELQRILDLGDEAMALTSMISGSGPTVALLARDANDAIAIASRVTTFGFEAIVTSSPASAAQKVF
ncbi:MAG: 4-(cytidine 5'-diphospho)-2-C-methyl-D-erythritol kinase [Micrococcales bacterium]